MITVVGLLFASQAFAGSSVNKSSSAADTFAEKASVKEINNNSDSFLGQRVEIEGEVEDIVMGGQSFILEGDTWTDNEILVVSKGRIVNLNTMADNDEKISLTGTVKHANFYEIDDNLEASVDPNMEIDKKKGVTYILLEKFNSAGKLSE